MTRPTSGFGDPSRTVSAISEIDQPRFVMPLGGCNADVADQIGGKALGLGLMTARGLTVPTGFALTVAAYRAAVSGAGLDGPIAAILEGGHDDRKSSDLIGALFESLDMPGEVAAELAAAYEEMGAGPVAVRSSALAEDTAIASFAGQQDTYLWIEGNEAVCNAVKRCWASLYTPQVIGYRRKFDISPADVAMGVVVQTMVPAVAAGVAMTLEPLTGDRDLIYIESALGLGEGVVKGDVGTDSAWIDKATLQVRRTTVGEQTHAHRFDSGGVRLVELQPGERTGAALDEKALRDVAELARAIEFDRGRPMDIEWALDGAGIVHLLQARPETVWSSRPAVPENWRSPNILHNPGGSRSTWTITNAAEGSGDTMTPLGASLYIPVADRGFRLAFHALGALSRAETVTPVEVDDRVVEIFYGQPALNLSQLCSWGSRVPGTSGRQMGEQIFSHVPDYFDDRRRYWCYLRVVAKIPGFFARYPGLVRADRKNVDAFWRNAQRRLLKADKSTARKILVDGEAAFARSVFLHMALTMGVVQPAYDVLERLARTVGMTALSLMGGHGGHEETVVLDDVWACAQGLLTLDEFLLRHGYHGPSEGEISSAKVWREDPEPVRRLIESYREKDQAPNAGAADRAAERRANESEFLRRLPRYKRPLGRIALHLAARYVPMRGTGKVAFLQCIDVVRASARRIGVHLAAAGELDRADDVFMLTVSEVEAGCPENARTLIAERGALFAHYKSIQLPAHWRGLPEPVTAEFDPDAEVIEGTGASPGIIEGPVRIVEDPGAATIVDGEILVANCTDPSWASLMFLSAGLIADVGGVMSHTAVVARELSIPCVVNTKSARHVLKDGDCVRMNGSSGRIEIISRASGEL